MIECKYFVTNMKKEHVEKFYTYLFHEANSNMFKIHQKGIHQVQNIKTLDIKN